MSTSGPIHTSAMSMSRGHMRTSLVILCNSTTIEQSALLGSSECKVGLDGSKRKKVSGEVGLGGDGNSQKFFVYMYIYIILLILLTIRPALLSMGVS